MVSEIRHHEVVLGALHWCSNPYPLGPVHSYNTKEKQEWPCHSASVQHRMLLAERMSYNVSFGIGARLEQHHHPPEA